MGIITHKGEKYACSMETILKSEEYERKLKSSIYYFTKEQRRKVYGLYIQYKKIKPMSFEMFVDTAPWDFSEKDGVETYFLY